MNTDILYPLITTSFITILGWYIAYYYSRKRDIESKKKELRITYLIDAWEKLEYAAGRKEFDKIKHLEKPISNIQLFGNKRQVKLAMTLAKNIVENKPDNLTEV